MILEPPLWATGAWAAEAWADGSWSTELVERLDPTADVTVVVRDRARTIVVPADPEVVPAQPYARTVVVR